MFYMILAAFFLMTQISYAQTYTKVDEFQFKETKSVDKFYSIDELNKQKNIYQSEINNFQSYIDSDQDKINNIDSKINSGKSLGVKE